MMTLPPMILPLKFVYMHHHFTHPTLTVRMKAWYDDLPVSVRYLIVSSFIASHNSKEHDLRLLTSHQSGRRKAARKETSVSSKVGAGKHGRGSKPSAGVASGKEARNAVEHRGLRAFNLERLMCIYTQVAGLTSLSELKMGEVAAVSMGPHATVLKDTNKRFLSEMLAPSFGDAELFSAVSLLPAMPSLLLYTN